MSDVAESANAKLDQELQFFFEADPADGNRLYLYMYYEKDIDAANDGDLIVVYKQILLRDNSNADWKESGTYLGYAVVGDFYGGGNNGKSVRTVDAYSWKAGTIPTT